MAAHSSQWSGLELGIPIADFVEFNKIAGPFPALQSLSIQITDYNQNTNPFGPFDRPGPFCGVRVNTVHDSPHLETLMLTTQKSEITSVSTSLDDLEIVSRSLKVLQISTPVASTMLTSAYFADVFQKFPNLRHFNTTGTSCSPGEMVVPPIESLLVRSTLMLGFLEVPTLEHLQLGVVASSTVSFFSFLTRSKCQLTTLSLYLQDALPDDALTRCFADMPSLTTLELIFAGAGNGISSTACCRLLQSPALLPRLRTLIITVSFVALVQARPALLRAELHMWSRHADVRRRMLPPGAHIEALLGAGAANGKLDMRVTTETYAWPRNARDEEPCQGLGLSFALIVGLALTFWTQVLRCLGPITLWLTEIVNFTPIFMYLLGEFH
ncbi:hypothetical protein B0H19DRAFT_1257425 [Mycena capillaripes]|nr:hypothetical protein B0H19DRAFT_1257425 [Mycena capillaripes]